MYHNNDDSRNRIQQEKLVDLEKWLNSKLSHFFTRMDVLDESEKAMIRLYFAKYWEVKELYESQML